MKIQDKYLWLFVLSFVFAMACLVAFAYATVYLRQAFWLICGGVSVICSCWNFVKACIWLSRARKFKNVFGVEPPDNPKEQNWKQYSAKQPIVDQFLKTLARFLHEAYEAENKIKDQQPRNLDEANRRHNELMQGAPSVAGTSKAFWDSHNLAQEYGFEVWGIYQDYIVQSPTTNKRSKEF